MSKKAELQAKACTYKYRYLDLGSASFMAQRRSLATGDKIEPYQCYFCKLYHIGHAKPKKRN